MSKNSYFVDDKRSGKNADPSSTPTEGGDKTSPSSSTPAKPKHREISIEELEKIKAPGSGFW